MQLKLNSFPHYTAQNLGNLLFRDMHYIKVGCHRDDLIAESKRVRFSYKIVFSRISYETYSLYKKEQGSNSSDSLS